MRMLLGRGRDRGAAAVEAAIIFPLLILLTFGIIEVSLLLRDYVSLNTLVRQGTRTASTLPRLDPATTTPPGQDLAVAVVADINAAGNALPEDTYEELWIYEANSDGYPLPEGQTTHGTCTTNCVIYKVDGMGNFTRFSDPGAPFWDWQTQNACPGTDIDSVGVWLKAKHQSVTGLLFDDLIISDFAVTNFEPIATFSATNPCGPTSP